MKNLTAVIALTIGFATSIASAQAPPNDECSSPTPISGPAAWNLDDLNLATNSVSPPPIPGSTRDIWYCWTATWNGVANIDLGFGNLLYADVFAGCACPDAASVPIVSVSPLQRSGTFDVQCDHQYLIRVAAEAYPFPAANPARSFSISKLSGRDCPLPAPGACDTCCGTRPSYTDTDYAAFTGRVAISTAADTPAPGVADPMVEIFNLEATPQPPAIFPPLGFTWDPAGPANSSFRYGGPSGGTQWRRSDLGTVFGLTLDDNGNIYVAQSTSYPTSVIGGVAGGPAGGWFTVYKIANGTGIPTVFAQVPAVTSPSTSAAGLGNLTFDCERQVFFVSNFADGRIYRLNSSGTILDSYKHAFNGAITPGSAPEVGNPYSVFTRLGERVWAVQVHNGRLYYSVWGQYHFQPGYCSSCSPTPQPVSPAPNTIWSVALTPGNLGGFVANSRRMELQMPIFPGALTSGAVADISFSSSCRMAVAERMMAGDECVCAHHTRVMEYVYNGTAWVPGTTQLSLPYFPVGQGAVTANAAGGVDYDFFTSADIISNRLWATGDALGYPAVNPCPVNQIFWPAYGICGMPTTAPSLNNSIWIDYNDVHCDVIDKTRQGDVEVPCPDEACLNVANGKAYCPQDGTTCFTYTVNITNKSGFPVKYITVPLHPSPGSPITINPNIINLLTQDGSLLEDGETTTITLTICGAGPGDHFCVTLGLVREDFVNCCFEEICIDLPTCDCGQLLQQNFDEISCNSTGQVSFTFTFSLQNLSPFVPDWVIFIPHRGETASFVKDFFFLPPLLPGQRTIMSVQIVNAQPGEEFCFDVLLQHPELSDEGCCCAFEKCITVPECPTGTPLCSGDCDRNGYVNTDDLLGVINAWGPCPPVCWSDFDGNGYVNIDDLLTVINNWGACP